MSIARKAFYQTLYGELRARTLYGEPKNSRPKNTASLAKERLQIIVSHERRTEADTDFLPKSKTTHHK